MCAAACLAFLMPSTALRLKGGWWVGLWTGVGMRLLTFNPNIVPAVPPACRLQQTVIPGPRPFYRTDETPSVWFDAKEVRLAICGWLTAWVGCGGGRWHCEVSTHVPVCKCRAAWVAVGVAAATAHSSVGFRCCVDVLFPNRLLPLPHLAGRCGKSRVPISRSPRCVPVPAPRLLLLPLLTGGCCAAMATASAWRCQLVAANSQRVTHVTVALQVHKAALGRVHSERGLGLRFPRFLQIRCACLCGAGDRCGACCSSPGKP